MSADARASRSTSRDAGPIRAAAGRASQAIAAVRDRLTKRADSEHEMTFNRLILNGLVFAYLFSVSGSGSGEESQAYSTTWYCFFIYNFLCVGLFVHLLYDSGI